MFRAYKEDGDLSLTPKRCMTVTLRAGQRLCWHKPPWVEPDVPLDVVTVYDDDDLLAVHKPAGLPTLPGSGYLKGSRNRSDPAFERPLSLESGERW